jgi:SAM-dependent methyltransferase
MADPTKPEHILDQVRTYYGAKVREHGPNAHGVDWNSTESHEHRFRQFLRLFDRAAKPFSVLDFGCGYGALREFLATAGVSADYYGFDISTDMIDTARRLHADLDPARFSTESKALTPADFVIASGILNVKLSVPREEWHDYVLATIDELSRFSKRGFGFNLLTSYSDADRMREELYYGDPGFFFDLCKRRYGRNVALLHDYELYEFTMLVRK